MSFSTDISRFVKRSKGDLDAAVRKATVMVAQGVILKSPVDTGRFRANWVFGVSAPDRSTTEAIDPSGQTTVSRLVSQIGRTKAGGVVYLANNLPYAIRLENGWSSQAPAGMVRLTAMEFDQYAQKAFRNPQS